MTFANPKTRQQFDKVAILRPGSIIDDAVYVDREVAIVVHFQSVREAFNQDFSSVFGKILMHNRVGKHLTNDDGRNGVYAVSQTRGDNLL